MRTAERIALWRRIIGGGGLTVFLMWEAVRMTGRSLLYVGRAPVMAFRFARDARGGMSEARVREEVERLRNEIRGVHPDAGMALLLESQEDSDPKLDDDRKLTPIELDVLRLAMIDRNFDEIAARLGITEGEALWRFQAARNKLGWELSPHWAAKRPAWHRDVDVAGLTEREQAVVKFRLIGKSSAETAAIMGLSPFTVSHYLTTAKRKLAEQGTFI